MRKKTKQRIIQIFRVLYLKLKHFFSNGTLLKKSSDNKMIIFCVNGWGHHGGWTDRLKGLISTYQYAKTNNYHFKIWYDFPCELNELLPIKEKLKCTDREKKYNPLKDKVYYLIDKKNNPLKKYKMTSKGKNFIYLNMDTIKDDQIWLNNFKEIFSHNKDIESSIHKVLGNDQMNIAFVFRFLNHLGDFSMVRRQSLNEKTKNEVINNTINKIKSHIKDQSLEGNLNIYIFSDSDIFINRLKKSIPFLINLNKDKRKFIHYKNQKRDEAKETLGRTLFDFMFMSNCDEIHHFISPQHYLYNSGFPKYASKLNKNNDYKLINLDKY